MKNKKEHLVERQSKYCKIMGEWLTALGVSVQGLKYGSLKIECAKKLGIYRGCIPKDVEIFPYIPILSEPIRVRTLGLGFYETDEWRRLRYRKLVMSGGVCQCCGARPVKGKPLHVDHIKPRSKYPHLELEISNLQVLCVDCNLGKGAWDETDWRD